VGKIRLRAPLSPSIEYPLCYYTTTLFKARHIYSGIGKASGSTSTLCSNSRTCWQKIK